MGAEFENGLFGCFDDIVGCLLVCFVPCYRNAITKAKVDGRPCHMCDCCCMAFHQPQITYFTRTQIRAKYGYENHVMDCLLSWICSPCASCQHAREVDAKEGKK